MLFVSTKNKVTLVYNNPRNSARIQNSPTPRAIHAKFNRDGQKRFPLMGRCRPRRSVPKPGIIYHHLKLQTYYYSLLIPNDVLNWLLDAECRCIACAEVGQLCWFIAASRRSDSPWASRRKTRFRTRTRWTWTQMVSPQKQNELKGAGAFVDHPYYKHCNHFLPLKPIMLSVQGITVVRYVMSSVFQLLYLNRIGYA